VAELSALQDVVEDIRNRRATLVAASPQLPEFLMQTVQKHHLRFNLLHDAGNSVARQFNLVWQLPEDLQEIYRGFNIDLEKFNGNQSWELPMPARFIIDKDGIIRAAAVYPDHTDRPEPESIIEVLDKL